MKKYAKQVFFNNLEFSMHELTSSNPRQYWKLVKMMVKENSNCCSSIPPLQINNNTYTTDETEKANLLNDYFVSISTVDDSNVQLPTFVSKTNSILEHFSIFRTRNLLTLISHLNVHKASGPDEFSHRMLRETSKTIYKPLCIIIQIVQYRNRCIQISGN